MNKTNQYHFKILLVPLFAFLFVLHAYSTTFYVAPTGNDGSNGSLNTPFDSWAKAQSAVSAGDTVYFRKGTYKFTQSTTACTSLTDDVSGVVLDKSGLSGSLIHYFAYPGETPVFDFSDIKSDCRIKGVEVAGSWIHMKGLEIKDVPQNNNKNHESWGVWITGSNNIFEMLNLHNNMGPGLFIQKGEGNLVLNCDSHDNYDPLTSNGAGESADGFGCHTTTSGSAGNVFRGCRAWWNSDDGYDCISCSQKVMFENCWSFLNGYIPETMTSSGNGNGFKVGGFGIPPTHVPSTIPVHTVENCVSFLNKVNGIYQNHHPVSNNYFNNTSYKNGGANFNMLGFNLNDSTGIGMGYLRNNVAYSGTAVINDSGSDVDAKYNSWNLKSVTISASDFVSLDTTGVFGPRKSDGSLPDLKFLHPSQGGHLIDKGTDVGLPYNGTAPDLGAYEYGKTGIVIHQEKTGHSNVKRYSNENELQYFDLHGRRITPQIINSSASDFIYLMKDVGEKNCKIVNKLHMDTKRQ